MTTTYLSLTGHQVPSEANIAEATSSPSTDFMVLLGGGSVTLGNMSRAWTVLALQAAANYILTDDPKTGGAGVLVMMP